MADEKPGPEQQTSTQTPGCDVSGPDSGRKPTSLVKVLGVRDPMPVSGRRTERIATIAALQRGHVARSQLVEAGISGSAIGRMIASGHLRPLHRAVFAVGHVAPIALGPETAALLACGDHAVLSHQSAALLWKLIPEGDGVIHATIRGRYGPRPEGVRVHRTRTLNRSDVRTVERLPVTSPARTLIDIAPDLDVRSLELAVEEAQIQRLVTERQLRAAAAGSNGRRGAGRILAILDAQREPGITRSKAERRLRELIRAAQLPEPLTNVRVHGYPVDFYWPGFGVVVEVQGYRFHSGRAAFERDTRKGAKLTAAGLSVSYVTWRQMEREPYAVVARVAQALARADALRALTSNNRGMRR